MCKYNLNAKTVKMCLITIKVMAKSRPERVCGNNPETKQGVELLKEMEKWLMGCLLVMRGGLGH